jgi:hypothetical protein
MGDGIRRFVPRRRRSPATALVAILALLLAAPFERGRGCSVCPVDCPMHAARRAGHLGCHQSQESTSARVAAHGDDGACAMRSSCGHHGGGEVVAFHADLPLDVGVTPIVAARDLVRHSTPRPGGDGPPPPDRPPRSSVV